jgi:cytochrome b-561
MIHVFVVPALLTTLVGLHLVVIVKQKHTQPGYARKLAEPGKVLGVPAWPYQALLAGQLFLLLFGGLFLLSAFVPAHPITAYGPPGPFTPEVKPDWYLLWIYGFLKIIPSRASFSVASLHLTVGPEFLGGVLFPVLIFGLMTLAPWIDRTNRRAVRGFQYLEPPRQGPVRFAIGIGVLIFIGMLFVAAYYDTLGLTLGQMWGLAILAPVLAGGSAYILARRTASGLPKESGRTDG